jgi:oxygen-dependent protoporphyrinogen oxidase
MLGVLFPSSLFESRAPQGGALLSVFLGGIKKPEYYDKPDDEIEQIVLSEIEQTLGSRQQPDLLRIFRYDQAIPQYEQSTGQRLEALSRIQEQFTGLIIAGNLRDGIGMADRVKQGRQIANQIIQEL